MAVGRQARTRLHILDLEPQQRDVAGPLAVGARGEQADEAALACELSGIVALARENGRDAAVAQYQAMIDSVAEVGRVASAEGIACDWALGGTIVGYVFVGFTVLYIIAMIGLYATLGAATSYYG